MNVSASDWRLASRSSPLTAVTWRLPTGPKAARVSGSGFRQQARWIWKRRHRQRFGEPELRSFLRRTAAAERRVWYPRRRGGEVGRAHVCTPVPTAHLVCRLLPEKQNYYTVLYLHTTLIEHT